MRRVAPAVLVLLASLQAGAAEPQAPAAEAAPALRPNPPVRTDAERPVDLVLCLDTSESMEDLLDSARARAWDIVNELARMTPQPRLRVGLISYGSPGPAGPNAGYVAMRTDLTPELDALYAQLMALGTDGGDEYVGWALQTAVEQMSWSPDPAGLRLIVIAGNESADQGVEKVDFRAVAEVAHRRDILINALYAGPREQAITEKWPDVARAGGGNFSAIDSAEGLVQVATPHDQKLLDLNARLNETYLPFGRNGAAGLANQRVQDNNATRLGVESCSSRVVAKGSALYDNSSWDLVDAAQKEGFQWVAVVDDDLPEALRSLSAAELEAHVNRLRATRERIQLEIQAVSAERETYLRGLREQREREHADGLDEALLGSLREQARAKGFRCGGC